MKKILLVVVLALVTLGAKAWTVQQDEGVVLLATKYLSPKAKMVVEEHLGTTYADDVAYLVKLEKRKQSPYSKNVHFLHLDANLQPMVVEGDDALKSIKQALAVVSASESHSKSDVTAALRTIINLMCDMHCISKIRIDGVAHSWHDFDVKRQVSASGSKEKEVSQSKWSSFWNLYAGLHRGFYGELWAEDMDVCFGAKSGEFMQGTLSEWVSANGEIASKLYSKITPENTMLRIEFLELEDLHYEMMARAAYRIAALLNENLK